MGYSCCDFTDDVFAEFHRVGAITEAEFNDENVPDNASLQAEYAINGIARLVEVRDAATKAKRFWQELLDSAETLTGIAEQHGQRTLADVMYLHSAIMNGSLIEHYANESAVLEIARGLPSGEQWVQHINVTDRGTAVCDAATPAQADPLRGPPVEVLSGYFGYQGTILHVEFQVPVGATTVEKDAAFMAALARQADIDYLSIGTTTEAP